MIIKEKILSQDERCYYNLLRLVSQDDRKLLENATTTGLIHFGLRMMKYPHIWDNERFELPFTHFKTSLFENKIFETISETLQYYDEGNRIRFVESEPTIFMDEVLPALNFGGDCWQHFTQDILPIIYFNRELLIDNPQIKILLYSGVDNSVINFFLNKLDIQNEILFVPYKSKNIIKCSKLYYFESNIDLPTFFWPTFFYKGINETLLKNESFENKNLIYNRRTNSRRVINENELISLLQNYASSHNLDLVIFESENHSIDDRFQIFKNAHTIVAPHGGANYNIIFSNPQARFIEYVFTDSLYALCNISGGIGLEHYIVPDSTGTNHTSSFTIDLNKLKKILNN